MDEQTLELVRKFSVTKPATSFYTTTALQLMVSEAHEAELLGRGMQHRWGTAGAQ